LTSDFEAIGHALISQQWIFAKTMPENPHEYALRKNWQHDISFEAVVKYIRLHGYEALYRGRSYRQIDINEHFYWTMGAPIRDTILINRKIKCMPVAYDQVAPVYDSLFLDGESLEENQAVIDMLGDLQDKSVLDVGCGTGLLLDYVLPQRYTGIDPSRAMLERLLQKHPEQRGTVLCTPLRSFVGGRYDVIIALFGTASYLTYEELQRIPDLLMPGGRYFLMFYKEGYVPITHIKAGIHLTTKTFDGSLPGAAQEYHNFVIVEGGL